MPAALYTFVNVEVKHRERAHLDYLALVVPDEELLDTYFEQTYALASLKLEVQTMSICGKFAETCDHAWEPLSLKVRAE